jgi:hypothetical protein
VQKTIESTKGEGCLLAERDLSDGLLSRNDSPVVINSSSGSL